MTTQSSMLGTLLFQRIQPPKKGTGRVIRFCDGDIDLEIATGTMPERVMALMQKIREPMTASEIARGTGSNTSQVSTALKRLVNSGEVSFISIEGCHKEYVLSS